MNTGLLTVSMNSCKIREEGAFLIAQGLAKNRKLKNLMIANNNINDNGLYHISEVLGSNSSLEHFDLSKNTISDEGIIAFSKALSYNRSLVTINLRHNQIGKEGGMGLREAVSSHKYLVRVFLDDNAIQIRDIEDIDRMCLKNREERAKRRMPQYEQELVLLVKGRKKQEVQETFLQLGLLKMAYEGMDNGRTEMEEELRGIKHQRKQPDPEVDQCKMII